MVLDPLNEVTLMKERDKLFFNRDILFGNTVRTMINLSGEEEERKGYGKIFQTNCRGRARGKRGAQRRRHR